MEILKSSWNSKMGCDNKIKLKNNKKLKLKLKKFIYREDKI